MHCLLLPCFAILLVSVALPNASIMHPAVDELSLLQHPLIPSGFPLCRAVLFRDHLPTRAQVGP